MKTALFLSSVVVAAVIVLAPGNANAGSVSFDCYKGNFTELANKTVCKIGAGSARPGDTLILKGEGYLPSKAGVAINYGPEVTFKNDDGIGNSERVTMYSLPWQSLYRVDGRGSFTAYAIVPSRLYNGRYTVTFPLNEINCGPPRGKSCQKITASLLLLVHQGKLTPAEEQQKKDEANNKMKEKKLETQSNIPSASTKISIAVATYITDNNLAFAPRIQRTIPNSLIPGQPFAIKVEHSQGHPFVSQHNVRMELISSDKKKSLDLGTFEVSLYEPVSTLKEVKSYNTSTKTWNISSQSYIWHSFVPAELYSIIQKDSTKQPYTLRIKTIDETPFIQTDDYEGEVPVSIEIFESFSPEKRLPMPKLAEEIIIKPDSNLILKGSNFPPDAKITKVIFGQRKWWLEVDGKDNRKYIEINGSAKKDGTLEAQINISDSVKADLTARQESGETAMRIYVEVEESVDKKYIDFEKRIAEFKKFENSENGKHTFVIDGVAKIVSPDKIIEPVTSSAGGKKENEGKSVADVKKPAAQTPAPKPKPAPSVEPVQEKKITIHCEDIAFSWWRKPGENCEWKEKPATEEPAKPAPAPTPAPKVEPKLAPIDELQENPCAGKEGYQLSQCKYFYGITDDKKPEAKKLEPKKDEPTPTPKPKPAPSVEPVQEKKITTHCEDIAFSWWRKPGENCEWKEKPATEEPAKDEPTPAPKKPEPVQEPKIEIPKVEEQKKEEPKQDQEVKYCDPIKPMFWQRGCVERPQDQKKEVTYCSLDKPITFQPGCVERP